MKEACMRWSLCRPSITSPPTPPKSSTASSPPSSMPTQTLSTCEAMPCMADLTHHSCFRTCLPIITYLHISPYIRRIANGDASPILSSQPISEFLTSSGTSAGDRKLMPFSVEELNRRLFIGSLVLPIMKQYLGGLDGGKCLYFSFTKPETKTPSGIVARPVLTSIYKSPQFIERYDSDKAYTSPLEAILCLDIYQSMYCHVLCGLIQSAQVLRIGAAFATGIIPAINFLQQHWKDLCHDIAHGELNERITDPSIREAVSTLLHPHPSLAKHVEQECSKPRWEGILKIIWPNAKCIETIITGSMSQYISMIDYYSGGLPLVSSIYASSECCCGLNMNPFCKPSEISYTFLPNMAYFEFLPVKTADDHQKQENDILNLTDVKVGEEYELVVTTYCGLYRYKVGDVLRCSGFYNKAPHFQFICRKDVMLSIDVDKTDEECLHKAVRSAADHLELVGGITLIDYTSHADLSTIPGHYVLFWEIQSMKNGNGDAHKGVKPEMIEECCLIVEESLDAVYRQCRGYVGIIGALEIRLVGSGAFEQLMDECVSGECAFDQYKTPRCITSKPLLDLLNSKVSGRYFSPKLPFWSHEWSH